jgi:transcriptional regulator with XRE-family HTH domain
MDRLIVSSREVLGEYLSGIRKEKGISMYRIMKDECMRLEQVKAIESGLTSYTIDSFLKYTRSIGVYMFFGDKSGKDDTKPIDLEHIVKQAEKSDPKL